MNIITEKTQNILEREELFVSPTARIPYYPLVVESAKACTVIDIEGNSFIDFLSSAAVINTGHNHPAVVTAVANQLEKFIHYTPAYMYHKPHTDLAEKLCSITPGAYNKKVAFGLSGSSSVDGAIKLAKSYTGRQKIISFLRSYHGTTYGALSVSGFTPGMRTKLGVMVPEVHFIHYPDSYRLQYGSDVQACQERCLKELLELFETLVDPEEVAAIIYEPIQGDAGVLLPPKSFMEDIAKIAKQHGILLIADEVQTGFGRTGKMFASEYFDFDPDILVLGKALASGMPLSAIVAHEDIMNSWQAPIHFFNTAGNAMSCVASLATIQVIEEEKLMDNALEQGAYITQRFEQMMDKFDCIGDIRGKGLLIGVDIVKSRETRERDYSKTAKICWRCWEQGLILAFFSGSVLRVAPPLVLTTEEAKKAMDIIESAISDVESGKVSDDVLKSIKGW